MSTGTVERHTRSGSHLLLRGQAYHYRRIVPEDARRAFGRKEVTKSLGTSNMAEAKRLEKALDVEFEAKLSGARAGPCSSGRQFESGGFTATGCVVA
jgi:hypothetical protein